MTLKEIYEEVKRQPKHDTPSNAFVKRIADVTKKSERAARRWVYGEVVPDALTQEVLAKHFNTTPQELFPN